MRSLGLSRYALVIGAAAAMLVGCGGSQPPIGAPGAMPQSRAVVEHANRSGSWMVPGTSSGELIYATGGCGGTCVFSYPDGYLVGTLPIGNGLNSGACSNANGDIFITDTSTLYEYAHGGSSPIATLALPGNQAAGCSIDPSTGNLAVSFAGTTGNIAVFQQAMGAPTVYKSQIEGFYCGYDNHSNLFADGYDAQAYSFSELPSGMSQFVKLSISQSVGRPGQVQWDGKYITYQGVDKNSTQISRLSLSGSMASVVSTTHFKNVFMSAQSWIYGTSVFHSICTTWQSGPCRQDRSLEISEGR